MEHLAEPQSYIDDGKGLTRESRADRPVCDLPIVSRTLCLPGKAVENADMHHSQLFAAEYSLPPAEMWCTWKEIHVMVTVSYDPRYRRPGLFCVQ